MSRGYTVALALVAPALLGAALVAHRTVAPDPTRVRNTPRAPGSIVVLAAGDSITAATYPKHLQALFHERKLDVTVVNAGIKGHTSGEYLAALASSGLLERTDPDFILLQLGTNDVRIDADHTDTARFYRQMNEILDRMLTHQNRRGTRPVVFLATIPPVVVTIPRYFDDSSTLRVRVEINPTIRRLARERNLPLVDIYDLFIRHPEWIPEIHPSEDGYRAMAQEWFAALSPQLARRVQ